MKERYSRGLGKRPKVPNPFLSPETAYHYEASYMRTFGDGLRVDSAVFYSEVKDAINEVNIGRDTNQFQNVGKETFKGFELAAAMFATDNLTLGANYTYTQAKNKTADRIVTNIPKHKFFAYADWKIIPNVSLYISQEAEHGRYYLDGNNTVKLSGFGNTNAKVTYNVTEQFSVEAGVSNLFDKNYYYQAGYPEEGRVYFSNLKYSF
ncbi:Outer membrane cobalamin translocator [Aggregatibacter aphrophilus]|nr:Outer membrane cobalamin translocator [Aggregatibacter aphrophilus]